MQFSSATNVQFTAAANTGFRTESILCIPLTFEGRIIGVLEVLNKKDDGRFENED